jgi:hypothetical protein
LEAEAADRRPDAPRPETLQRRGGEVSRSSGNRTPASIEALHARDGVASVGGGKLRDEWERASVSRRLHTISTVQLRHGEDANTSSQGVSLVGSMLRPRFCGSSTETIRKRRHL